MITAKQMQERYDAKTLDIEAADVESCKGALDLIEKELLRNLEHDSPLAYAEFRWAMGEVTSVFPTLIMNLTSASSVDKALRTPFTLTRIGARLQNILKHNGFSVEIREGYLKVSY